VEVVSVEEGRAAVGFEAADVEHVLGHDRVPDRAETAPPGALLARAGGLAVVAQQAERGRRMDAGPVPLGPRRRRKAFGRTEVHLVEQVVGDHAQPRGLRGAAGRLRRVGHRLHARPARVLARERPDVDREPEVVRGVLEVPAGALRGELERRIDAVEREPVLRGAAGVVLAHPRDEREVRRERAEAVREALGHHRIERANAVLDVVVHGERGHPVRFEGEGAEAALDELREQLVADRPERGLAMIGLAQGQELVGVVDEIADVLSHGLKPILESSVEPLHGSTLGPRSGSLNLRCNGPRARRGVSSVSCSRVGGMTVRWPELILGQLEFYWDTHLRPRLEGLTDDEYLWEPVDGCWSLRPGADGALEMDEAEPAPEPPPVTTIAWRMVHIGRDVLGVRARSFFGPHEGLEDAHMWDLRLWPDPLPATAADAIAMLESSYRHWCAGVRALDAEAIERPLGPKGAWFADFSMAALVLHLNREVMAHGAEICLLRDLYRAEGLRG
jgi:hypothetical protein